jgi:hypothetical protein
MRYRISISALIIATAVACLAAPKLAFSQGGTREASKQNVDAVWNYLKPVIFSSGRPVRLYYRADCHVTNDFIHEAPIPFPLIKVQPPSIGKTGLAAMREIFQNDERVAVTEDGEGIIRIRIGEVPTKILETKLSLVALKPTDQYNPDEALGTIIKTKEMGSAMHSLRISTAPTLAGAVTEPMKELPHLPASIRNVTAEKAIDLVAKTWAGEGIVVYGICAEPEEKNGDTLFSLDYLGDVVPKGD